MRKYIGNVLWGLLFIGAGIGLIGNALEFWDYKLFFDGWWTLFIIIPAFISMVQTGPKISSFIMLAVGVLFLLDRQGIIPEGAVFKFALPIILIIIGFSIISKIFFKKSTYGQSAKIKAGADDNPDYIAVFSGNSVKNNSSDFKGGSATAIFGGNEIDLSDVVLNNDVSFTVTSIFGGNEIKAPKNAKIEMQGIPIFGGNENKAESSKNPDAYTITFVCTSIFGGTEIN